MKQILRDAQAPPFHFMPARAGWNGPEAKPRSASLNPTYEKLKYANSPEALRREIKSVILPDARALAALLFLILALRFMKMREQQQLAPAGARGNVLVMPHREEPSEQAA